MPAGRDVDPRQQGGERPGWLLHERTQALPGHDQPLVGEQRDGQPHRISRGLVLLDEIGLARQAFTRAEYAVGDLVAKPVSDLLIPSMSHGPHPLGGTHDSHHLDRWNLPTRAVLNTPLFGMSLISGNIGLMGAPADVPPTMDRRAHGE